MLGVGVERKITPVDGSNNSDNNNNDGSFDDDDDDGSFLAFICFHCSSGSAAVTQ